MIYCIDFFTLDLFLFQKLIAKLSGFALRIGNDRRF